MTFCENTILIRALFKKCFKFFYIYIRKKTFFYIKLSSERKHVRLHMSLASPLNVFPSRPVTVCSSCNLTLYLQLLTHFFITEGWGSGGCLPHKSTKLFWITIDLCCLCESLQGVTGLLAVSFHRFFSMLWHCSSIHSSFAASSIPYRKGHWGTTDDFITSFLHFLLFSTALWDFANSRLVFFPLSLCLARWFWPDLINGRHDHTTAVSVSLRWS